MAAAEQEMTQTQNRNNGMEFAWTEGRPGGGVRDWLRYREVREEKILK